MNPNGSAARQALGGILMLLAVLLAWVFRADGIARDEMILSLGTATMGGLIFDSDAAVRVIRAFPWPWKRADDGASGP